MRHVASLSIAIILSAGLSAFAQTSGKSQTQESSSSLAENLFRNYARSLKDHQHMIVRLKNGKKVEGDLVKNHPMNYVLSVSSHTCRTENIPFSDIRSISLKKSFGMGFRQAVVKPFRVVEYGLFFTFVGAPPAALLDKLLNRIEGVDPWNC